MEIPSSEMSLARSLPDKLRPFRKTYSGHFCPREQEGATLVIVVDSEGAAERMFSSTVARFFFAA
jgi:hypothetical protein